MMAENYKIYESEVNSEGNLKIKQKSVFLSNINAKDKVISYEDLIVFGDIKAKYLLVSGNLIVLGNINVKEVDIEGSLIYSQNYKIPNINVDGQTILIDKYKDSEEDKPKDFEKYININEINIDNLKKNTKFLSDINNLKNRIIDEICNNEPKYYLENIYSIFTKLENTFIEFKQYSDFIGLLLLKYRSKPRCDKNLINYLKVINYKMELPSWLLKISYIEEILRWIDKLKIKNMTINLENESEVNEVKYLTYKCKDELGDKFDEILTIVGTNEEVEETEESKKVEKELEEIKNIEELELVTLENTQKDIDINRQRLYEKYIQKRKDCDLIEGIIKNIEEDRIILTIEEDQIDVVLRDSFDIGDKSLYKIGDKINVYVLCLFNEQEQLDIEVSRNDKKCVYDSICKLDIPSLSKLKLNDMKIINKEEVFIFNCIERKEDIENIESIIKDNLLLKNVRILDPSASKTENISRIFNIDIGAIVEDGKDEYIINVFNIESYRAINILNVKYKDLLKKINVRRVQANKLSIKIKYNSYYKKVKKLIKGKVKEKNEDEYIIDIEPHVKAKLKYVNANKKYNINDTVIAKIEVLSLNEEYIYLGVYNKYERYIQDLLEYEIKEYNAQDMIRNIDIDIKDNKFYNIKILLNQVYDKDVIYKIKNEIEEKTNKEEVSFTILEFKYQDRKFDQSSELNKDIDSNDSIDKYSNNKYLSTEQIIKMFNQKKKEHEIPDIKIKKKARVSGYKTVILSSELFIKDFKDNLLSLQFDMESELKGERIKIILIDKDITKIIADIMGVEKNDVEVDHNSESIKIYMEQKFYNNINEASEKILISEILPYTSYYKIDFIIKNDNFNQKNIVSEEYKKNKVDDDILNLLFK